LKEKECHWRSMIFSYEIKNLENIKWLLEEGCPCDKITFSFIVKKPPIAEMIKKAIGKEKGAGKPGKESAGILSVEQAKKIAEQKLEDLNTDNIEAGAKIVAGVARSMGVQVQ